MTVVWSWADLGDHALEKHNVKQYWLISSVLSVRKFNPEWKCVFFVDEVTYNFINSKDLISLWDEVRVVDFKNTEYGNLYNLKLYSWPKIYTYGLIDDDILVLDVDTVFKQKFIIPDVNKVCGPFYNFTETFYFNNFEPHNVKKKYKFVKYCQYFLKNTGIDYVELSDMDVCITGSPVYVPKGLGDIFQKEILDNFIKLENIDDQYFQLNLSEVRFALEEEYPIAYLGKQYCDICNIDSYQYFHRFTSNFNYSIIEGLSEVEEILEIPVFDKYIKN
jgi:hypothetical protein